MTFKFNTISEAEIRNSNGGSSMMAAINYSGPKPLLVTGCPGSGKTTVTIMRAARLHRENKNIFLLTYQNLLKINLASSHTLMRDKIETFWRWYSSYGNRKDDADTMRANVLSAPKYDEILIDEGQDFELKIYQCLLSRCTKISVGADTAQKVHEHGVTTLQIDQELQQSYKEVEKIELCFNYRNTFEIYNFARQFMPDSERANHPLRLSEPRNGAKPMVFQARNETEELNIINTRLRDARDVNTAVLVYHEYEVEEYYKRLTALGYDCSKYYYNYYRNLNNKEKERFEANLKNIVVTTYKSAKGLEFQVVIMPNMEQAMQKDYRTPEHYYVGCTRAKQELYLIYKGNQLPTCLKEFPLDCYELSNHSLDELPF